MTKAVKVIWITTLDGQLGIVLTENGAGEKNARIKNIDGIDEAEDIKVIMEWGSKFRLEDAELIVKHLGEE